MRLKKNNIASFVRYSQNQYKKGKKKKELPSVV